MKFERTTLENEIESWMQKEVKASGGIFFKFTSPANSGVPDRILIHPALKRTTFIELKAPGKKPRPLQVSVHRNLKAHGADVFVIDSRESAKTLLETLGILKKRKKKPSGSPRCLGSVTEPKEKTHGKENCICHTNG